MKRFDVQTVEIDADFDKAFAYIAEPRKLPEWTAAFRSVSDGRAVMQTTAGSVDVGLNVRASKDAGTIDWIMQFPDQTFETAYSRLVRAGDRKCVFSFLLMAPKVPMEQLEGTLEQQSAILRKELDRLSHILSNS